MLVVPFRRDCVSVFCSGGDAALGRAALDHAGERLLDAGKTFVEELLLLFEHDHVAARGSRDLRDARAHQAHNRVLQLS